MICPDGHGLRHAVLRGRVIPCASCGGCGIASCCDGAVGCGLDVANGELASCPEIPFSFAREWTIAHEIALR
jgi:hypothetical protein